MKPNSVGRTKWILAALAGLVLAALLPLRAGTLIPVDAARKQLEQGAVLVDVRTVGEFEAGHLANAVNVPLGELKAALPLRVPDKGQTLLLYCRSGRRSGIAQKELLALGYTNSFNLGSFNRASEIVQGAGQAP